MHLPLLSFTLTQYQCPLASNTADAHQRSMIPCKKFVRSQQIKAIFYLRNNTCKKPKAKFILPGFTAGTLTDLCTKRQKDISISYPQLTRTRTCFLSGPPSAVDRKNYLRKLLHFSLAISTILPSAISPDLSSVLFSF